MPLWDEADLALKSITNEIPHDYRNTNKTRYNNDAMWCFSKGYGEQVRDIYAHIEGTYKNGKFTKIIKQVTDHDDDVDKKSVLFYCCYKYDYLEALNHLPTDYVRPNEIAQAAFIGKTRFDPKTKNNCCDGTYQRSKDKHNDRFMWDKVTTTEADRRIIFYNSIKKRWCVGLGSSDER
jgi:hypothetical protein